MVLSGERDEGAGAQHKNRDEQYVCGGEGSAVVIDGVGCKAEDVGPRQREQCAEASGEQS